MNFELPALPYDFDALAPHISERTLTIHYSKHHRGYVEKLESAIAGTSQASLPLEELVCTLDGDDFNNAAQVWNHSFYWRSLSPDGGGNPTGELASSVEAAFGSVEQLRHELAEAAKGEFGSGWAWLVVDENGRLRVTQSSDAENPLRRGRAPLLTIDVWEHAYYLDYQNRRADYVEAVIDHLIDWRFAEENFASHSS